MKKSKLIALSLAASLAFSFASVSDVGIVGTNPAHAASSSEALGPDFDASLHRVPVTTRTHYFVDSDEKGPLLRSHWSAIDFYGKPEEPAKNISVTLANYSREKSQDFEKTRREMLKQAKQDRSERLKGGSTFFPAFESRSDINVRRADSLVVSFQENGSDYTGGAHGMFGISGRSFNTYTGRELKLFDIFTDMNALSEAIKRQLMFDYPKSSFAQGGGASMRETVDRLVRDNHLLWTLDPRGVTFYFNPYLLGSYAEGIFTTTLFFTEYPDIYRKDEYRGGVEWKGPKAYCMELPQFLTMRLSDSPRDERISVSGIGEDITIVYCGETLKDPVPNKEIRPVFVHCNDGKQYLYVDYTNNKKDFKLRVYDLNGESPKLAGEFDMTRLASSPENPASRKWYVMSDPNDFYLTATAGSHYTPGKWLRCRIGAFGEPDVFAEEGGQG